MEGYDGKLLGAMFAQPSFQRRYGERLEDGSYQVTSAWQAGLGNGSSVGGLMGLLIAGWISERFGFRKTMIGGLFLMVVFIFVQFLATSLAVLEVGQILLGIPLGMFQTVTTHYAVEVTPACLRGYLTTYVNLCWVFGQLLAAGVMRAMLARTDEWSYKIPFAIQWIWPVPLMIGCYFAPESPWWLIRKNKPEEAKGALVRLTSNSRVGVNFDVDKTVALMTVTTEYERGIDESATYFTLFKRVNLRRTLIVQGIYCTQSLSGAGFRNYSTYFYTQAGLSADWSFNMSIIQYGLGILGTFAAWFLLPRVGRRTFFIWGLAVTVMIHCVTGGVGFGIAHYKSSTLSWVAGSMILLYTTVYDTTVGPIAYALVAEIPSGMLRSKSIVVARSTYNILGIVLGTITPYMLNPSSWNWGAKSGLFWAGTAFIALVFAFFCIPETKDRTFAELDVLFDRKIPARHFSETMVNLSELTHEKGLEYDV
ncbi:hypothetical protein B7463_g11994, partial [Scytalidium lignicola]